MLDLAFRDLSFPRLGSGRGADTTAPVIVGNSATITAFGETITLSAAADYGYDQLGRAFIVTPPEGLSVLSRSTAASTIDGQPVNGIMLNPQFGSQQGWDGRMGNYNAGLNVALPRAVAPGDILVTATAMPTPTGGSDPTRKGFVLPYIPFYFVATGWAANAIAPSPVGWAGRGTPLPDFVDCAAIAASLPSFDVTGWASLPDKADLLPRVQRTEIALAMTNSVVFGGYQQWTTQGATTGDRGNYGSFQADTRGVADLLISTNALTVGEKATLLAWRIANGKTIYDTRAGAGSTFAADGGHHQPELRDCAIYLRFTGRSGLLNTMVSVIGGNQMRQLFEATATHVSQMTPHSSLSELWQWRIRTVTATTGATVTFTTDRTGGQGDPGKFGITNLTLTRVSDAQSVIITAQDDVDSIATGTGTFTVTVGTHPFIVGDQIIMPPPWPVAEGDVFWGITEAVVTFATSASYTGEQCYTFDVLALHMMGAFGSSIEWDLLKRWTARANISNEPTPVYDFPDMHLGDFSEAFWNAYATQIIPGKPLFLSRPTITGTVADGQTLTAVPATVAGTSAITTTWQWTRDGSDISGATGSTLTLTAGDVGTLIRVRQIATNGLGSSNYISLATLPVAPASSVTAVEFDGVNDWLHTTGMSAPAASKQGALVFSLYVKDVWPSSGNIMAFRRTSSARVSISPNRNSSGGPPTNQGRIGVTLRSSSASTVGTLTFINGTFLVNTWYTVAISWNTATQTWVTRIRPQGGSWLTPSYTGTPSLTLDALVDTTPDAVIGALDSAGAGIMTNWYASDVWYAPGQLPDFTNPTVLDAFLPTADKGSNGEIPTGTAPLVFLSGPTVSWHANKGTGTGFTEVGEITTAPVLPT